MGKRILIISASLRRDSNSDALADAFMKGAEEKGNDVRKISLKGKRISFCIGCMACHRLGHCAIDDDDAIGIADEMKRADIIAFATPVYYYGMSGQLKTMLDRANSLYTSDYSFRNIYLLASAAEDDERAAEGTEQGIRWWTECFGKARFMKTVFAGGVDKPGDIQGHEALRKAYETGLDA